MRNSQQLKVRPFTFVEVKPNDENISEVMRFCGVPEERIEQERIFHDEGDQFLVPGNLAIDDVQGDYLIKTEDGIVHIRRELFKRLFAY